MCIYKQMLIHESASQRQIYKSCSTCKIKSKLSGQQCMLLHARPSVVKNCVMCSTETGSILLFQRFGIKETPSAQHNSHEQRLKLKP